MSTRDKQSRSSESKPGAGQRGSQSPQSTPATDMQFEDAGSQASDNTSTGGKPAAEDTRSSMKQTSKTEQEKGSSR